MKHRSSRGSERQSSASKVPGGLNDAARESTPSSPVSLTTDATRSADSPLMRPDLGLDLDLVPNVARHKRTLSGVMANSFAFSGSNAVLAARHETSRRRLTSGHEHHASVSCRG